MKINLNRREFLKTTSAGTLGLGIAGRVSSLYEADRSLQAGKIGIIGLDTSHSTAFTKALNDPAAGPGQRNPRARCWRAADRGR